jgi:NAD-dependent DNA ligase
MEKYLENKLREASSAYYSGSPIMTDQEFDALARATNFNEVGTREGRIPHAFRMWSLQKVVVGDMFPFSGKGVIVTPKLDGSAISILYIEGELQRVLTRGDGKCGIDITEKFRASDLIPQKVDSQDILQVTGEIVAPKSVPNSRNYAAGSLNLKDISEFLSRDLAFIAYGLEPFGETYMEDVSFLQAGGFDTVIDSNWAQFPHDGTVWRLDSNEKFRDLGYTSHHPRGAFAVKKQQKGVTTTLLDVDWQVGKSGVVSPVAILEPCTIGEATVSRATLHNKSYIEELGLYIGCEVEVIRSGEIIPRIVGLAEK